MRTRSTPSPQATSRGHQCCLVSLADGACSALAPTSSSLRWLAVRDCYALGAWSCVCSVCRAGYLIYDTLYSLMFFSWRSGAAFLLHHVSTHSHLDPKALLQLLGAQHMSAPSAGFAVRLARCTSNRTRCPAPAAWLCLQVVGLAGCALGLYWNKLALFGMAIEVFFEATTPLLHVSLGLPGFPYCHGTENPLRWALSS